MIDQEVREIINQEIEKHAQPFKAKLAELERIQNGAFEVLSLETISGIITLNKYLSDLQKQQILAVLNGPKQTLTYLQ